MWVDSWVLKSNHQASGSPGSHQANGGGGRPGSRMREEWAGLGRLPGGRGCGHWSRHLGVKVRAGRELMGVHVAEPH